MAKLLASAVVILIALWLISELCAAEINHESNFEGSDFYFDEKPFSLNKSTQHGHSARFKTEVSDKDEDHKSAHKFHKSRPPESATSTWDMKRLLQYVVFLLQSVSGKNNHESELPNDDKYERVIDSNRNKTKKTGNTPRNFKDTNKDNGSDSEFENSGGGDDNDYYDGENLHRNTKILYSTTLKDFNTNLNTESVVQNREGISRDSIRNRAGNKKLTAEIFQSHQAVEKDSSSRDELVSGEFIDKIINRPITNVPVKEDGKLSNSQSIIQKENGKLNYTTLKENARKGNIPTKEHGELIDIEAPISSNIVTKGNLTSSKELSNNDFFRTEMEKSNRTSQISPSVQVESETSKSFSSTSAVKRNPNNYSESRSNTILISETPKTTENYTLKIIPFHSNLPKQTELSTESTTIKQLNSTKESVYTSIPTDVFNTNPQLASSSYYYQKYDHEQQNTDVAEVLEAAHQHAKSPLLDFLPENKSLLSETHQNKDTPAINSSTIRPKLTDLNQQKSSNIPKLGKDAVLNSTSFVSPPLENNFDFSRTLRVFNQNSSFPKEIKLSHTKDTYFTTAKNNTYDRSSENFTGLGGSRKNSSLNNSSLNPELQSQSQKKSDDTVILMPHYQLNITKDIAIHDEFNSTDTLSPQNEPTERENSSTKLKNNVDTPNKQHSVKLIEYSKSGEKQNRENFNIYDKLKGKNDSDTDSDSGEDSGSDESYEDEEYDNDEEDMSDFTDYLQKIISNVTTHLSQNSSTPNTNYSVKKELQTVSKNGSKIVEFPKAPEIFDSILEFIYRYSKHPLFTRMREQKNVTSV